MSNHKIVILSPVVVTLPGISLRWLETLFEKCEKNGFEHDIVDYYRILKGKEYHSGTQK